MTHKRNFSEAFAEQKDNNSDKKNKAEITYSKCVKDNFLRLKYFKFGYCVFCKNKIQADLVTNIFNVSTVICYHCGTDSVVPGECSRQLLNQWHEENFSISLHMN